jgi:hypothetical protein
MDIIYYCRLVFATAWHNAASRAQAVIFIIIVIMGAASWLLPSLGMTIDASSLLALLTSSKFYAFLFVALILVNLICAPYWVWKGERDARLHAESMIHTQESRKAIRVALGEFMASGRVLMGECRKEDVAPPIDETERWIGKVNDYLVKTLDTSYAERFHSAAGVQLTLIPPASETHKPVWGALFIRISRLHEFLNS